MKNSNFIVSFIIGLILFSSYFEFTNAQYAGEQPTLEEAIVSAKEKIEISRSQLEKEDPEYYYCHYILQIPFGCTLLLGGASFYFLVLGIIVSVTIVVLVLRKRKK